MYLTSMTHEELYAEVHKDLIEISTKANMFMDKVRKKTRTCCHILWRPSV